MKKENEKNNEINKKEERMPISDKENFPLLKNIISDEDLSDLNEFLDKTYYSQEK